MPSTTTSRLTPRHFDVLSDDGTRIRAWTNDADGPAVLLCNGLGTSPYAWPALLSADCGVRVVSWYHRGIGGSERPVDPERVGVGAGIEDALAVMAAADVERATLLGWSIGVNHAFEIAVRWPARADAVMAVAGVPGDTFATMLAPFRLPRPVNRRIALGMVGAFSAAGPAMTPVTRQLHRVPGLVDVVRHTGFMFPRADRADVRATVEAFLDVDVRWYMHLARHAARHPRVSLSQVRQPTTFVAGRWDVLAGARDMRSASERIDGARFVELAASHFLPLERPDEVHAELLALIGR
ncbi:alpha/beta fold hydrolase [Mumia flava]|uniref:alpha/beta fold hydrolase n=1 Tax=Mumia flava TaxID=1348852 RepID=UPI001FE3D7EA|nr:alpha/beta hydrolase [Mumia flava]